MTPERINELAHFYRGSLLDDCAKFWFPRSFDHEHGGYLHCLDRDGSVLDTDKSVWAQGRMAWMLATLYNTVERRPEWLEGAKLGLDFLDKHCFDSDGRMFFHVTRYGKPIRKRRYAYSESFAAIAHAAYAKATGNAQSATRAHELFDEFGDWNFTPGKMRQLTLASAFCGSAFSPYCCKRAVASALLMPSGVLLVLVRVSSTES